MLAYNLGNLWRRLVAARAGDNPAAMSFSAAETVSGSSGGRPGVRPCFLAAAMPSRVRSEMSWRSKCAMEPKTWNTSSPAADEVSRRSLRLIRWMPRGLEAVDGFEQLPE